MVASSNSIASITCHHPHRLPTHPTRTQVKQPQVVSHPVTRHPPQAQRQTQRTVQFFAALIL